MCLLRRMFAKKTESTSILCFDCCFVYYQLHDSEKNGVKDKKTELKKRCAEEENILQDL